MEEITITGEQIAGQSAAARKALESLIANIDKSTYDVAELLVTVKKNYFYQPEFDTFKEYTDSLKIKARKVQYLTKIVETYESVGVPRIQYEPLGIARNREITSLEPGETWTNPENGEVIPIKTFILGFVEKDPATGDYYDLKKIQNHVRTLKGKTGADDIEWVNIPFIRADKELIIDPALEQTRALIGSVGKDEEGVSKDASTASCIKQWAVEFMNDPNNNPLNQQVSPETEDEIQTEQEG